MMHHYFVHMVLVVSTFGASAGIKIKQVQAISKRLVIVMVMADIQDYTSWIQTYKNR